MSVVHWLKGVFESKKESAQQRKELKEINEQLVFAKSEPLTLGVEFELALVDKGTLKPVHQGLDIIAEANQPAVIKKEQYMHMVEVTTLICRDVHEAKDQMGRSLRTVMDLADKRGLLLTGTGRPPTILLSEYRHVEDQRHKYLQESRKVLYDRFGALGTHIHIGMESAEKCIRYHNFYMHFLPHLVALAAGSPFEDGMETGLASIRPSVHESLPTAGMPYNYKNWQEYVSLVQALYRAGSIRNLKDMWWDQRPSPRYGTLEIRICDQFSNLGEAMAVVAFVHALGHWFEQHQSWLEEMPRPSTWRLRENKWRAMRYGLDGKLVVNGQGDTIAIAEDIKKWLERTQPEYTKLGYEPYRETLLNMLARGNSAKRQQAVWAATGSLDEVARFNCRELQNGKPLWQYADDLKAEKADEEKAKTAAQSPGQIAAA